MRNIRRRKIHLLAGNGKNYSNVQYCPRAITTLYIFQSTISLFVSLLFLKKLVLMNIKMMCVQYLYQVFTDLEYKTVP